MNISEPLRVGGWGGGGSNDDEEEEEEEEEEDDDGGGDVDGGGCAFDGGGDGILGGVKCRQRQKTSRINIQNLVDYNQIAKTKKREPKLNKKRLPYLWERMCASTSHIPP